MGYKYLGILEANGMKDIKMKETIGKEDLRRIRKVLKSKLNGINCITVNSRVVSIIRYGEVSIKWTKEELERLDQNTKKLLKVCWAFH